MVGGLSHPTRDSRTPHRRTRRGPHGARSSAPPAIHGIGALRYHARFRHRPQRRPRSSPQELGRWCVGFRR